MVEAKSIEALSVTFTAGVAAGALFSAAVPSVLPAILLPVASLPVFLAPVIRRSKAGPALILLTFLTLGIFVSAQAVPFAGEESFMERMALEWADNLKALISRIPFKAGVTAPLLTALLTGDKSGLGPETIAAFRGSGASHILALSGLHMGILYLILDKLTLPLGKSVAAKWARAVMVVSAAGWFTLMTGAGPSIVRAFLFILIGEICTLSGRRRKPSRVLCLALLVQLVINPGVIRSLGFQLSYLAMSGIVILYPTLEKWYPEGGRLNPLRKIWQMAALAISCQVFTGPLSWIKFGTFPRHFILTNLMAIPIVTVLMWFAVITIALTGLGWCPELLITITDGLSRLLEWVLTVISS
ncbi:MAG: ComEC/Rec2 family competence protein [Bacteroidales bacterium]|nr:ComEC/Rec2 family competence protein [Bacteroidales bacterium]